MRIVGRGIQGVTVCRHETRLSTLRFFDKMKRGAAREIQVLGGQ